MMKNGKTFVGADTANSVFQLYRVELETGKSMALQLRRARFPSRWPSASRCCRAR